jgi:hypothetical protein
MTHWLVYTRRDCSLCEEMLGELAEILGPAAAAAVEVTDVDSNPDLAARYGQKVPVLLADGEFLCSYRLDRERLQPHLADNSG